MHWNSELLFPVGNSVIISRVGTIKDSTGWRNQKEHLHEIKGWWWALQTGSKMNLVQKSQYAAGLNSIQPWVEAPEGWWACMCCSWVGQPEHPCPQPCCTCSHQGACFSLEPPQKQTSSVHPASCSVGWLASKQSSLNVQQINTWVKIIDTIYWTLTLNFTWVVPFNLIAT